MFVIRIPISKEENTEKGSEAVVYWVENSRKRDVPNQRDSKTSKKATESFFLNDLFARVDDARVLREANNFETSLYNHKGVRYN